MSEFLSDLPLKVSETITDWTDLILCIIGSGAAGVIYGYVKKYIPAEIPDEAGIAVVGLLIWLYGDRIWDKLPALGFGMFLAGVSAWVGAKIEEMLKK